MKCTVKALCFFFDKSSMVFHIDFYKLILNTFVKITSFSIQRLIGGVSIVQRFVQFAIKMTENKKKRFSFASFLLAALVVCLFVVVVATIECLKYLFTDSFVRTFLFQLAALWHYQWISTDWLWINKLSKLFFFISSLLIEVFFDCCCSCLQSPQFFKICEEKNVNNCGS